MIFFKIFYFFIKKTFKLSMKSIGSGGHAKPKNIESAGYARPKSFGFAIMSNLRTLGLTWYPDPKSLDLAYLSYQSKQQTNRWQLCISVVRKNKRKKIHKQPKKSREKIRGEMKSEIAITINIKYLLIYNYFLIPFIFCFN